jgi:hypothetical protein
MRDDHFLERAQSAITGASALVPGIAECAIAYTIRAHHPPVSDAPVVEVEEAALEPRSSDPERV